MCKKISLSLLLLLVLCCMSGCTVIRYVTDPGDDDGGDPPPPKQVDVLLMVELERSTVQLADKYEFILTNLRAGLAEGGVTIRKLAVAPMYRRAGGAVPLIYGEGADSSEFDSFSSALSFFALDGGQKYLRDRVDGEGENLAALGLNLESASLYHPTTASSDASPYFTTANDGFLVVQLTAKARTCAYGEASCQLSGKPAAEYFTEQGGDNHVSWLALTDSSGLPRDRVMFLSIATAEGVSDDQLVKRCERKAGFDANNLDSLEASPNVYYEEFSAEISRAGGWSDHLDMCDAMSLSGVPKMVGVGKSIGKQLNRP